MNIYYLGHSSFLIKTKNGKRILTDPFKINSSLENIDIITISHAHFDHSDTENLPIDSKILNFASDFENNFCKIKTFNSYHDNSLGLKRGPNLIFHFIIENISLCHLGDLGHMLDISILKELKNIDILFIPVGENYTLNLKILHRIIETIRPKFIIPMHYRTSDTDFSLNSLDKFLLIFKNYQKEKLDTFLIPENYLKDIKTKIIILDKTKIEV
ncbi:MBL fold metallo-hydrolase [uncultured Clostridium sp.]|jgi:L-ascorbate metabolism protein UlaG (beta-lactamase superfamily)|uniref:MBL fold metallo-hydrolase n=1 Tax=uncultured Clostridium sp. TaxID=59620 RepID=UPI00262023F4|nr:MBL fold metallo-hydrolase [uncultured Clostridium sp.]